MNRDDFDWWQAALDYMILVAIAACVGLALVAVLWR